MVTVHVKYEEWMQLQEKLKEAGQLFDEATTLPEADATPDT